MGEPEGGGNYHANAGITHVGVADQAATVGNPESVNGQTRLVVHYKPASDSDNRGVYVWGTDAAARASRQSTIPSPELTAGARWLR